MAQNPEDRKPVDPIEPRRRPRLVDDDLYDVPDDRDMVRGRDRGGYGDRYSRRPRSDGGGGAKQYVVMALVALVVVVVANLVWLSPAKSTDVNKALDGISADIRASKATDTTMQASITTLTNQVSGMTSANAANAQAVAAQNSKIDTVTNQANGLNSQIGSLNTQLAAANADIAKLKAIPGVNPDLQKAIDADKAAVAAMQKQIDDINKKLTTTVPSGTTGTVTPGGTFYSASGATNTNLGTSNTLQGVTATLTNIYGGFNGIPILTFSVPSPNGGNVNAIALITGGSGYSPSATGISVPILQAGSSNSAMAIINTNASGAVTSCYMGGSTGAGYTNGVATLGGGNNAQVSLTCSILTPGTAAQTITMTVTNAATNPVINNLQLALGLAVVDSNGNPLSTLPTWMTPGQNITVTSGGFGTSWTFQSVVAPNTWVFSNVASTNPFGMGAISLQPGQSQTFTQYINVSNSLSNQAGTLYLYPIIRVLSFTG